MYVYDDPLRYLYQTLAIVSSRVSNSSVGAPESQVDSAPFRFHLTVRFDLQEAVIGGNLGSF